MSVEITTLAGVLLCIALCIQLIMKACKHDYKIRTHDIGHKSAIVQKYYKDHQDTIYIPDKFGPVAIT